MSIWKQIGLKLLYNCYYSSFLLLFLGSSTFLKFLLIELFFVYLYSNRLKNRGPMGVCLLAHMGVGGCRHVL